MDPKNATHSEHKLSIIIPTLNEAGIIADTVGRLNRGLSLPHEVIISDGKSKDETCALARAAGAIVVEYTGSTRQTIAMGRNDGAAAATGDFLAFMDADCHFEDPQKFFATALAHFDTHPKTVAITVSIRVQPQSETFLDKWVYIIFNNYMRLLNNIFGIGMAAGELQFMRRSAFDKVGGYNPTLVASEDIDLFYRLSKVGKIDFLYDEVIYHTGRRAHKIGWVRLLSSWISNSIAMYFTGRALSKEWKVIR